MNTKEKAKELVNRMYVLKEMRYDAKRCTLICVNEILEELEDIEDGYRMDRVEYWQEVKQEIKKL